MCDALPPTLKAPTLILLHGCGCVSLYRCICVSMYRCIYVFGMGVSVFRCADESVDVLVYRCIHVSMHRYGMLEVSMYSWICICWMGAWIFRCRHVSVAVHERFNVALYRFGRWWQVNAWVLPSMSVLAIYRFLYRCSAVSIDPCIGAWEFLCIGCLVYYIAV